MKLRLIYNYLSLILIIVIFIIMCICGTNSIEYFQDATTVQLEKRINDLQIKCGDFATNYVQSLNDKITKYDNMYGWYQKKIAADTAVAKEASASAQASLKEGLSKPGGAGDPSLISSITENLISAVNSTNDPDNQKGVNNSLNDLDMPDLNVSPARASVLAFIPQTK